MHTNFIAVYGPVGPLYLLKTDKNDEWYVINGAWLLKLKDIPIGETSDYKIVHDDFGIYTYEQACNIINNIYDERLPYKSLCSSNLRYFNKAYITTEQQQKDLQGTFNKLSMPLVDCTLQEEITIPQKALTEQAKELCKHFNVDCSALEIDVCKELLERGFKLPENTNMNTLNTEIVTTETVHKVNGQDVNSVDTNVLLNYVVQLENSIIKLQDITTKSTFITAVIKEQQETLAVVVKHLDARS